MLASSALLARCPLRRRYASFARGRHDRGCGGRHGAFVIDVIGDRHLLDL